MRVSLIWWALLGTLLASSAAPQSLPPAETEALAGIPGGEAYGTADLTVLSVSEAAFVPLNSEVTWDWEDGLYATSVVDRAMIAKVDLPTGAVVEVIQMEACDTNASASVSMSLFRCTSTCVSLGDLSTGVAATPGCDVFVLPMPSPFPVIENLAHRYILSVQTGPGTWTTRFRGARIFYRREVSPAPSTATFADVPVGHPLHQYVEALSAAAITAGCGEGNFCPNDPITRGQMAVFLAKALGLHWPN